MDISYTTSVESNRGYTKKYNMLPKQTPET